MTTFAQPSRFVQEDIEEIRRLENDRVHHLFHALWDKALAGDHKAVDTCLRVMAWRAKLLGLDAGSEAKLTVNMKLTYFKSELGPKHAQRKFRNRELCSRSCCCSATMSARQANLSLLVVFRDVPGDNDAIKLSYTHYPFSHSLP